MRTPGPHQGRTTTSAWRGGTAPGVPLLLRQLLRFGLVGLLGTAIYLLTFLGLRVRLDAQAAGATARVLVAVPTTWVNSRFTFARRIGGLQLHAGALALLVVGMLTTSGALLLLQALITSPSRTAEVLTVTSANLLAASVRFLLLRLWMSPDLGLRDSDGHLPGRFDPAASALPCAPTPAGLTSRPS